MTDPLGKGSDGSQSYSHNESVQHREQSIDRDDRDKSVRSESRGRRMQNERQDADVDRIGDKDEEWTKRRELDLRANEGCLRME